MLLRDIRVPKLTVFGSLGIGVVSAARRKFFTTDVVWAGSAHNTDYTDFLLFSVLIREIRG